MVRALSYFLYKVKYLIYFFNRPYTFGFLVIHISRFDCCLDTIATTHNYRTW